MISIIVYISLLPAQLSSDALFTGTLPPNIPTFEITLRGREPFYAGIQINGEWLTDHSIQIAPIQNLDLYEDSPFAVGKPIRVLARSVEYKYEPPAMRRSRLEKLWTASGYIFMETPSGNRPVKEQELKLAQRAREMAQDRQERLLRGTEDLETPADAHPPRDIRRLVFARLGIVLAGLAVFALLFRFAVKKEKEWTALE